MSLLIILIYSFTLLIVWDIFIIAVLISLHLNFICMRLILLQYWGNTLQVLNIMSCVLWSFSTLAVVMWILFSLIDLWQFLQNSGGFRVAWMNFLTQMCWSVLKWRIEGTPLQISRAEVFPRDFLPANSGFLDFLKLTILSS